MLSIKHAVISCIILFIQLNVSPQTDTDYNSIDGFAAASSKRQSLKVRSGKIYTTHAELIWEEYWENDKDVLRYFVMWGTDTTNYTDTLNLQPYEENTATAIILDSLVENSEYYGEFYRDYKGDLFNVKFRFNTPPLSTVSPVVDSSAVGCRVPPNSIRTGRTGEPVTSVEVFSIDGRRLYRIPVDNPSRVRSAFQSIRTPGIYIIRKLDVADRLVKTENFLVGN